MDSRFSTQPSSQEQQSFNYPQSNRQPAGTPYSAPHRLPPTSIPPSHALPPLSSHHPGYTYTNDASSQRGHNSQPLYFSGGSGVPNHNGPFPIYPPTATTQFQPQTYPPPSTRPLPSPSNYAQSWGAQSTAPHAFQSYNSPTSSQGLPNLLPMPNTHMSHQNSGFQPLSTADAGNGYNSHQDQRQSQQQNQPQQQQQQQRQPPSQSQQSQPTHVVGSQGRRGTLPSASGRPAAVVNGSSGNPKPASTPVKDSEGKFPCEHCDRNYLHAKHLKRHLLRRKYPSVL